MPQRTHHWIVTEAGSAFGERLPMFVIEPEPGEDDTTTMRRAMRIARKLNGGDAIAFPIAPRERVDA